MAFGAEMVIRGSQERVAPVLMTALTTWLGLVPLILSAGQPGKEILYPVGLVVVGGMFTTTLLDFFITPTVFLRFGRRSSEHVVAQWRATQAQAESSPSSNHRPVGTFVRGVGRDEIIEAGSEPHKSSPPS